MIKHARGFRALQLDTASSARIHKMPR